MLTIFIAIVFSALFNNALPLLAIQILWINLVTDGFPALALGIDPSPKDIMERSPKNPKEKILSKETLIRMGIIGLTMMAGTLFVFKWYLNKDIQYAQTMAFSTLVAFQMFNVLNCRSQDKSIFKVGLFSNKWLIGAIVISILLQIAVIHTSLGILFKTVPLQLIDWMYVFLISSSVLIVIEIQKLVMPWLQKH